MKIAEIKVDYIGHYGTDLTTANSARVSFDKISEWESEWWQNDPEDDGLVRRFWLSEKDTKLINYLAKHKHRSPFNHSFISVRVHCPVFVRAQLVKHKFMPLNEVSRRYVDSEPEFYMPEPRARAANVKQGSSTELVNVSPMLVETDAGSVVTNASGVVQHALDYYNHLLAEGVCPEVARAFLPQNMMTTFIWSGTLGSFADMLVLRLSPYTQAETRIVAEQVRDIVQPLFPVSLKALLDSAT